MTLARRRSGHGVHGGQGGRPADRGGVGVDRRATGRGGEIVTDIAAMLATSAAVGLRLGRRRPRRTERHVAVRPRARARGTRVTYQVQMGPGRSGLSLAIDRMPDKEPKIVYSRLKEFEVNMTRTLEAFKRAAENAERSAEA